MQDIFQHSGQFVSFATYILICCFNDSLVAIGSLGIAGYLEVCMAASQYASRMRFGIFVMLSLILAIDPNMNMAEQQ